MTICLHSGSHPIARVIRWFTHSRYSHVSLLLDDGRHVEAREWKGVIAHPVFSPKPSETVDFFTLTTPLNPDETARLEAFIAETLGEPYDWRMVAAFALGFRPNRASETAWFCAEYVAAAFIAAGRPLVRTDEPYRISPGDLSLSTLIQPCPPFRPTLS